MIITIIYRLIATLVILLTIMNIITEKDILKQFDKALVIIPLILRVLMIK